MSSCLQKAQDTVRYSLRPDLCLRQCEESFLESILGLGQEKDPKWIPLTPSQAASPEAPEDFPGTKEKRGDQALDSPQAQRRKEVSGLQGELRS